MRDPEDPFLIRTNAEMTTIFDMIRATFYKRPIENKVTKAIDEVNELEFATRDEDAPKSIDQKDLKEMEERMQQGLGELDEATRERIPSLRVILSKPFQ